jgi:hypothetical protein
VLAVAVSGDAPRAIRESSCHRSSNGASPGTATANAGMKNEKARRKGNAMSEMENGEAAEAAREKREREVVEAMARPGMDVEALVEATGIALTEIAQTVMSEGVEGQLHGVRMVGELQAQLMLSRWRSQAVGRMLELGLQKEDNDLAFGACKELIKADLLGQRSILQRSTSGSPAAGPTGPSNAAAVSRVMEIIGERAMKGEEEIAVEMEGGG